MELKHIDLVLENCESVRVERKYIGYFIIKNLKSSITRIACNSISKNTSCEEFAIGINRNLVDESDESTLFKEIGMLERLKKYNDIVAINITYENGDTEYIFVPWKNHKYECDNTCQKSYQNEFGDLYIVISKEKCVADVFSMEEINDKDGVDFSWEMYSE